MRTDRRGMSLVEIFVVLSLIAILLTLIMPAIQRAKERGRSHCLKNFRNVSLALMSESAIQQRLTPQATYIVTTQGGRHSVIPSRSWVVDLLPHLDYQSAYDRWDQTAAWDSTENAVAGQISLEMLTCPQDEAAHQVVGGMSMRLNCGISDSDWKVETGPNVAQVPSGHHPTAEAFDWNTNGQTGDSDDVSISRLYLANWPTFVSPEGQKFGAVERTFLGQVYDGHGNTILLLETSDRLGQSVRKSWANPSLELNAFVAPVDSAEFPLSADRTQTILRGRSPFVGDDFQVGGNHPGVFVAAFYDGSVRPVSHDIDEDVFLRLLTPSATMLEEGNSIPEDTLNVDEF